jgi:hypothetical protein
MWSGFLRRLHVSAHDPWQVLAFQGQSCSLFRSSHGMRNELSLSSEVALDGSSWHVCSLAEEAYPGVLQASDNVIKGVL